MRRRYVGVPDAEWLITGAEGVLAQGNLVLISDGARVEIGNGER